MRRLITFATASAVALAAISACGQAEGGNSSSSGGSEQTITVFAASSLTESFTTISAAFEAANPGVSITLNFGPSSGLATQITEGAPADVFASASEKTMDTVVQAQLAVDAKPFATNTLAIATPANPSIGVTSLSDLANPAVKVAVCQPDVPCGVAAAKLFERNSLSVRPVSQEADVKAVLSKVRLGEVDAGIVYVTDITSAKNDVVGVAIPSANNVSTTYPITVVSSSTHLRTAQAFVDFVLSAQGQSNLAAAGFSSP